MIADELAAVARELRSHGMTELAGRVVDIGYRARRMERTWDRIVQDSADDARRFVPVLVSGRTH